MGPSISIIIPVFNVENYLDECLNSILNQTFKDYEVIIIDDGSTDKSKNIIFKYKNYINNMIFLEQENQGVSVARQRALEYVNGKYLMFLDPDDYLDIMCLERCFLEAERSNSKIVIYDYYRVDESNNIKELHSINVNQKYLTGIEAGKKLIQGHITAHLWNKLILAKSLKETPLFFDIGRYSQDWFPVFEQLVNAEKVSILGEPLYYYRERPGSAVCNISIKRIDDFIYATDKIIKYIKDKRLEIEAKDIITFQIMRFNSIIALYSKIHKDCGRTIYKMVPKDVVNELEPKLHDVVFCPYTPIKIKISILSWKLRIRHIIKR